MTLTAPGHRPATLLLLDIGQQPYYSWTYASNVTAFDYTLDKMAGKAVQSGPDRPVGGSSRSGDPVDYPKPGESV